MLDATMLAAIAEQARQAFLLEDAPECIQVLERGLQQWQQGLAESALNQLYQGMGRAAHSLKGGAAMAAMETLQGLCHSLEALFEALEQGRVQDTATAWELIAIAIAVVQDQVITARQSPRLEAPHQPLEISQALKAFLSEDLAPAAANVSLGDVSDFVRTALVVELEACLERVEKQVAAGLTGAKLWKSFQLLLEECILLGQALNCDWLENLGQGVEVSAVSPALGDQITATITTIRTLRDQFLEQPSPPTPASAVMVAPAGPVERGSYRPAIPVTPASPSLAGGMDADLLAAIASEARQAFLEEDAPDCLAALSHGFTQLQQALAASTPLIQLQPIFKTMGRAAHSLKGGAGMAELSVISRLCHSMEDVFEALEQNQIQDISTALQLLSQALDQVQRLVDAAAVGLTERTDAPALAIAQALAALLAQPSDARETPDSLGDISNFVRLTLTTEVESRLTALEQDYQAHRPAGQLQALCQAFLEDCVLLGQSLSCPWLVALAEQALPQLTEDSVRTLMPVVIANIRQQRQQFLATLIAVDRQSPISPLDQACLPMPAGPRPQPIEVVAAATVSSERRQSLRIPLERLIGMSRVVSELLINHEQLLVYDRQLRQASLNLKNRNHQLIPLREQVESLYDQLSFAEQRLSPTANPEEANRITADFDALEFDRYTTVHSLLQRFQETMVQVQEIQEDVETVERDLQETLIQVRRSLQNLDQELTQSRLLPFGNLARSFIPPLAKLNQRHNKNVHLQILGESVLLELGVFEQLRTPLTHLIRNAFDHGMETPEERLAAGKSPQGTITLTAALTANQITISIADDGRGIDPEKIRQTAVAQGLISEVESHQASPEAILDYLFAPGFSTAETVSDLSGRGLGLDIVKQLVDKLRGNLRLESHLGQGSRFLIRIPLSLNIMPLLLVRTQQQLLAFPSENVLQVLSLKEYVIQDGHLEWQGQTVRVCPLEQLLHYSSALVELTPSRLSKVGLVVNMGDRRSVLTVEQIVDERPLVVKAFDPLTPLPTYLGGCTVLGTGEVVPILLANNLDSLWNAAVAAPAPSLIRPDAQTLTNEPNTILIIDDSVTVRRTLNRVLARSGYQVLQCRDGQEAWALLNRQTQGIALAICDLEMPNMDGFTLMRLVRSHPIWQGLPIIVLTSRDNPLHRQRASELGAPHYLTKPFQPNYLLETLAKVLTR